MNPNNKPDPKAQAAFEAAMKEKHTMVFTKAELTVIFNILTGEKFQYGNLIVIHPIVQKLHPIVAVDSNIPPKNEPIIGSKKAVS